MWHWRRGPGRWWRRSSSWRVPSSLPILALLVLTAAVVLLPGRVDGVGCTCTCPPAGVDTNVPCPDKCSGGCQLETVSCTCTTDCRIVQGCPNPDVTEVYNEIARCFECCSHSIKSKVTCQRDCQIPSDKCNECQPGRWGANCDLCPGPEGNPCNGRGTCSDGITGTGQCACQTGAVGDSCQFTDADRCNGHGTAVADGSCVCDTGFGGTRCENCKLGFFDYPLCRECTPALCNNKGVCNTTSGACECSVGFIGERCEACADNYYQYPNCRYCEASDTCSGKGSCVVETGYCDCKLYHTGLDCAACEAHTFKNDSGDCEPCPGGIESPCNGVGTCDDVDGGGTCTCDSGYAGTDCSDPFITAVLGTGTVPTTGGQLVLEGNFFGDTLGAVTIGGVPCDVTQWDGNRVDCDVRVGEGADLLVLLARASDGRTHNATFSYQPPRITAITPSNGPTTGGTTISLTGKSFGASPSVLFESETAAVPAEERPQLANITRYEQNWQGGPSAYLVEFTLPAGAGVADVRVSSSGGALVSTQGTALIYDKPDLVSFSPSNGPTAGSFSIALAGSNFGDLGAGDLQVRLVQLSDPSRFLTLESGSLLVPSSGPDLLGVVNVVADVYGRTDSLSGFRFDPPEVTKVRGDGCSFNTAGDVGVHSCPIGGTKLTLTGKNFGQSADLLTVTMGDDTPCTNVQVTSPHLVITCDVGASSGYDLAMSVERDGRTGVLPDAVSFSGPRLTDNTLRVVSGTATLAEAGHVVALSTNGGDVLGIGGAFTGFETPGAVVNVVYGPARVASPNCTHSVAEGTFACDIVSVTESEIQCNTTKGVGAGLRFQVCAKVDSVSLFTNIGQDRFSYAAPQIDNSSLAWAGTSFSGRAALVANSSSGETVTFSGAGFGAPGIASSATLKVSYGPRPRGQLYPCIVDFSASSDSRIQCSTVPGDGKDLIFRVEVGGPSSDTVQVALSRDTYSYPDAPIVTRVAGCPGQEGNMTTQCPTDALLQESSEASATPIVLAIHGSGFGLSGAKVAVGGRACLAVEHDSVSPSSLIRCRLPVGTGLQRAVVVSQGDKVSRTYELVSYALPQITSICGCIDSGAETIDCPRNGEVRITIYGSNFGMSDANVLIGGQQCDEVEHIPGNRHGAVSCVIPPGTLLGRSVIVIQEQGDISPSAGLTISYVQCEPGFTSVQGSTTCAQCALGKFSSVTGATSCTDCLPGTVSSIKGADACSPCSQGRYVAQSGQRECEECPVGRAGSSTGLSQCVECSLGRISATNGSVMCDECPSGRYQAAKGKSTCTECELGKSNPVDGQPACSFCAPGFYADERGLSECKLCPPGSFQTKSGKSGCTLAPAGSYTNTRGQVTSFLCPPGQVSSEKGSSACSACTPGEFAATAGLQACVKCAPGSFAPSAGATTCFSCTFCESCGQFANGLVPCTLTSPVTHQTGSSGTKAATNGSAVCTACSAGRFQADTGKTDCDPCPESFYQVSPGQASCIRCSAGYVSNETASTSCRPCSKGRFADVAQTACEECAAGKFSSKAAERCNTCEAGSASGPGSSSCSPCLQGHYQPHEGHASCIPCSAGTATAGTGSFRCEPCSPGLSQHRTGQTRCDACLPGSFSDVSGLVNCTQCPAGTEAPFAGLSRCSRCSAGRFANMTGMERCSNCPSGTFSFQQFQVGPIACTPCPNGSASSLDGSSVCLRCEPGRYAPEDGQKVCDLCPEGEYQPAIGADLCIACPAGTANSARGQSLCKICGEGTYTAREGAHECTNCELGRYQAYIGQSACELCDPGRYSGLSASQCEVCQPGTFTNVSGSSTCQQCKRGTNNILFTACVCDRKYYASITGQCMRCPDGARCSEKGVTWANMETESGWWRSSTATLDFYRCLDESHCVGGRNSTCDDNRDGPLCALCKDGFQTTNAGTCLPCADSQGSNVAAMFFLTLAITVALVLMFYFLIWSDRALLKIVKRNDRMLVERVREQVKSGFGNRGGFDEAREINRGANEVAMEGYRPVGKPNLMFKLKIMLSFLQVATSLTFRLDVPWPRAYSRVIAAFNVFNIDLLQWSSVGCVTKMDYFDKLWGVTITPIVVVCLVATFFLMTILMNHSPGLPCASRPDRYGKHRLARKRLRRLFWKLLLFTMFLVYPHVSSVVLRMYVCRKVESTHYLLDDFNVECYSDRWKRHIPLSVIMIVLYPVGIPAFFLYLLLRYRYRFEEPGVRLEIGFLYDGYQALAWNFELVDMAHKLILVSLVGFLPDDVQLPMGMVVIVMYAIIILLRVPYWRKGDDRLHLFAQTELLLLMLSAHVFYQQRDERISDQDDIVMSTFLLLVLFGFLALFVVQTFRIFKVMFKNFRKWYNAREEARAKKQAALAKRSSSGMSAAGQWSDSSSSESSSDDDAGADDDDQVGGSSGDDWSQAKSSDSRRHGDSREAGDGSKGDLLHSHRRTDTPLTRMRTKSDLVKDMKDTKVSVEMSRRLRSAETSDVLMYRNPIHSNYAHRQSIMASPIVDDEPSQQEGDWSLQGPEPEPEPELELELELEPEAQPEAELQARPKVESAEVVSEPEQEADRAEDATVAPHEEPEQLATIHRFVVE